MATTTTTVLSVFDPDLDSLEHRLESIVASSEASLNYWHGEVVRLRKLARQRAELGGSSAAASANEAADKIVRGKQAKIRDRRDRAQAELNALRFLRGAK